MTKEEAYNKLLSIGCEVRYGAKGQGDVIKALEALGILKFEEKPPMVVRFNTKDYPSGLVIMVDGKVILP